MPPPSPPPPPPPSPPGAPADHRAERGARLGARLALALFTALSSIFVLSSTWQLCKAALFSEGGGSSSPVALVAAAPGGTCASGLRRLRASVEKALLAAAAAPNEATAGESFRAATAPDWAGAPSVLEVCRAEPDGADAYALVDRLRVAAESVARSRAVDLTTPRRDVAALLGP